MAETEDLIVGLSNGQTSVFAVPNNMVVTAAVQRARTRWEADAKKKQLERYKVYHSSKQQLIQKVIDTLCEDNLLCNERS
jgi:hypothetical protein